MTMPGPVPVPAHERVLRRVEVNGECWVPKSFVQRNGYTKTHMEGIRMDYAHRVVYRALVGPIPEGLDLDHLCRNRACVNPAHLEAVTRSVNLRRGLTGRHAKRKGPRIRLETGGEEPPA